MLILIYLVQSREVIYWDRHKHLSLSLVSLAYCYRDSPACGSDQIKRNYGDVIGTASLFSTKWTKLRNAINRSSIHSLPRVNYFQTISNLRSFSGLWREVDEQTKLMVNSAEALTLFFYVAGLLIHNLKKLYIISAMTAVVDQGKKTCCLLICLVFI